MNSSSFVGGGLSVEDGQAMHEHAARLVRTLQQQIAEHEQGRQNAPSQAVAERRARTVANLRRDLHVAFEVREQHKARLAELNLAAYAATRIAAHWRGRSARLRRQVSGRLAAGGFAPEPEPGVQQCTKPPPPQRSEQHGFTLPKSAHAAYVRETLGEFLRVIALFEAEEVDPASGEELHWAWAEEAGGVNVAKREAPFDGISVCGKHFVRAPPSQVWAFLRNTGRRSEWDANTAAVEDLGVATFEPAEVDAVERAEGYRPGGMLTRMTTVAKWPTSPREFLPLAFSLRSVDGLSCANVTRSCDAEVGDAIEVRSDSVRGILHPSGFLLRERRDEAGVFTEVTQLIQTELGGSIPSSIAQAMASPTAGLLKIAAIVEVQFAVDEAERETAEQEAAEERQKGERQQVLRRSGFTPEANPALARLNATYAERARKEAAEESERGEGIGKPAAAAAVAIDPVRDAFFLTTAKQHFERQASYEVEAASRLAATSGGFAHGENAEAISDEEEDGDDDEAGTRDLRMPGAAESAPPVPSMPSMPPSFKERKQLNVHDLMTGPPAVTGATPDGRVCSFAELDHVHRVPWEQMVAAYFIRMSTNNLNPETDVKPKPLAAARAEDSGHPSKGALKFLPLPGVCAGGVYPPEGPPPRGEFAWEMEQKLPWIVAKGLGVKALEWTEAGVVDLKNRVLRVRMVNRRIPGTVMQYLLITEDAVFVGQPDGTTTYRKEINLTQTEKKIPETFQNMITDLYISASKDSRAEDDKEVARLAAACHGSWAPGSTAFAASEDAQWVLGEVRKLEAAGAAAASAEVDIPSMFDSPVSGGHGQRLSVDTNDLRMSHGSSAPSSYNSVTSAPSSYNSVESGGFCVDGSIRSMQGTSQKDVHDARPKPSMYEAELRDPVVLELLRVRVLSAEVVTAHSSPRKQDRLKASSSSKKHALYKVEVIATDVNSSADLSWHGAYRFSDFTRFKDELGACGADLGHLRFPPKTLLSSAGLAEQTLAERKQMLEPWLNGVLTIAAHSPNVPDPTGRGLSTAPRARVAVERFLEVHSKGRAEHMRLIYTVSLLAARWRGKRARFATEEMRCARDSQRAEWQAKMEAEAERALAAGQRRKAQEQRRLRTSLLKQHREERRAVIASHVYSEAMFFSCAGMGIGL